MEKIYIVIERGGSYGDEWQSNRFAVLTEDEAKACIEAQERLREQAIAEKTLLARVWEDYKESTPLPAHIPSLDVPRWPAGLNQKLITSEMREERERILAQNGEIALANNTARVKYYEDALALQQDYARKHGLPVPTSIVFTGSIEKTEWSYEAMTIGMPA